ncbi:MAG TPA: PEP-CTERM sorting domain-containing protein, partial [Tepidisphaeraceae bacterium]|nr:PEP-CTERM sorting domain-containing protein [Tepidisphaeraceae bacterium]
LASHFNEIGGMTWQEGDLNYDGSVTISDFVDLAANFNSSYGPVVVSPGDVQRTSVPEPTTAGLLIASVAFGMRRRHGQDACATRCRPFCGAR